MDNLPVIAIRFALYADLMVLAGVTAFSLYALKPEERGTALLPLAKPALLLSLLGLLLSGGGMIALVAAMTGTSLWAVDGSAFREIVTQSAIGSAWVVRMAAVAIALLAALALGRSPHLARYCLLASAVLAIATLVWTGHAGATEGRTGSLHRLSDIVHMLAAAVWIGGIAAFSWLLFQPLAHQSDAQIRIAHRALEQFSRVGTLAVGLIVLTGIINSLSLIALRPTPAYQARPVCCNAGVGGCQPLAADTRSWCSHRQRQSGPRVTWSSAKPGSGNVHSAYDPRRGGLAGYAGADHGERLNYPLTLT